MSDISRIGSHFDRKIAELPSEKKKELESLKKACTDFESIFMHQMLKEMRGTINKTGLIDGGQAEQIFTDMLDQEKSKNMSIGIGDLLFKELAKSYLPPSKIK